MTGSHQRDKSAEAFWRQLSLKEASLSAEKTLIEAGVRREKRRKAIDRMAAAILLQSYLDSQNWQS